MTDLYAGSYVVCDRLLNPETNQHCEYDGRPTIDIHGYWRCPGCGARHQVARAQLADARATTATPKRIQMSRQKPWREDNPDAIVVDRSTKYGNPFRIGTVAEVILVGPHGSKHPHSVRIDSAQAAVDNFTAWIPGFQEVVDALRPSKSEIAELTGHDLACWCPLDQPCHADVLLEIAN